jgi:hypothetical protein
MEETWAFNEVIFENTDNIWEIESIVENGVENIPSDSDLVLHIHNFGSWDTISWFLSQYIPSLWEYSDTELIVFWVLTFLWILCVIWTFRDIIARTNNAFYQFISVLLVVIFTPIIWLPLYFAFRPLTYKWEKWFWRESLEQNIVVCPYCWWINHERHKMCWWCWEALHVVCKQCHHNYSGQYSYCPECWAPNIE